jgi:hypothetical protein
MKLAIVDIDGTLTQTTEIDAECYAGAVSGFLGHSISSDWASYVHVTDSGILEQVFRKSLGRSPTAGESNAIESDFIAKLEEAVRRQPGAFAAVAGASEFLARSRAAGWQVALATGDRSWASLPRIASVNSVPLARLTSFPTSAIQILFSLRWTRPACPDHHIRFLISNRILLSFGSRNHRHEAYARRRPRAGRATMTA